MRQEITNNQNEVIVILGCVISSALVRFDCRAVNRNGMFTAILPF